MRMGRVGTRKMAKQPLKQTANDLKSQTSWSRFSSRSESIVYRTICPEDPPDSLSSEIGRSPEAVESFVLVFSKYFDSKGKKGLLCRKDTEWTFEQDNSRKKIPLKKWELSKTGDAVAEASPLWDDISVFCSKPAEWEFLRVVSISWEFQMVIEPILNPKILSNRPNHQLPIITCSYSWKVNNDLQFLGSCARRRKVVQWVCRLSRTSCLISFWFCCSLIFEIEATLHWKRQNGTPISIK